MPIGRAYPSQVTLPAEGGRAPERILVPYREFHYQNPAPVYDAGRQCTVYNTHPEPVQHYRYAGVEQAFVPMATAPAPAPAPTPAPTPAPAPAPASAPASVLMGGRYHWNARYGTVTPINQAAQNQLEFVPAVPGQFFAGPRPLAWQDAWNQGPVMAPAPPAPAPAPAPAPPPARCDFVLSPQDVLLDHIVREGHAFKAVNDHHQQEQGIWNRIMGVRASLSRSRLPFRRRKCLTADSLDLTGPSASSSSRVENGPVVLFFFF